MVVDGRTSPHLHQSVTENVSVSLGLAVYSFIDVGVPFHGIIVRFLILAILGKNN